MALTTGRVHAELLTRASLPRDASLGCLYRGESPTRSMGRGLKEQRLLQGTGRRGLSEARCHSARAAGLQHRAPDAAFPERYGAGIMTPPHVTYRIRVPDLTNKTHACDHPYSASISYRNRNQFRLIENYLFYKSV